MIEGFIFQEEITILNIYALNTEHQNIEDKNWELKGKTGKSTIIVKDFNTFF